MTQIALVALVAITVAALAAAGVLARSRSRAVARAGAAEAATAHSEERARAAEARVTRRDQHLREAQAAARQAAEETQRAENRALVAEGRSREADLRTAEAEHRTAEAELHTRAAEERTKTAEGLVAGAEARTAEAGRQADDAEEQARALLAEIGHLAKERVAATALRLSHPNAPVAGPLDAQSVGTEAVQALQAVLDAAAAAITDERERVDAAARAAMRGATSKIQTLLYQIQSLVQQLQHENDDPRLLEVDFRNEVALRRIQTIAVLCEAWPGLARTDSPLAEVVVGALSRVPGYARIKVANHLRENRLAVVARAAEPLAITVAELLANATGYSHPETDVPVTVQQGGRGALVIIDDSGIGMEEDQLRRARRLLAGPPEVLLTELGNPPKTGFAVVGKLARQYGFACHIEPSPYGGMRTIVRIPAALLTVVDDEQPLSVLTPLPLRAGSGPAPAPTMAALPPVPAARGGDGQEGRGGPAGSAGHDVPPGHELPTRRNVSTRHELPSRQAVPTMHVVPPVQAVPSDDSGLPSRRRRQPLPHQAQAPQGAGTAGPAQLPPARTPEQAAERWGALQQGTGSGRAAVAQAADRSVLPAAAPVDHPADHPAPAADHPAPAAGRPDRTDRTDHTGETDHTDGTDHTGHRRAQTSEGAEQ
ncbi:ATP-binding protein [Kitasatospora sp. NPDC058170]|uniref:ATP-binding protein n=1 Tax=Kitasatospora sp. NPDC058170 TaxID=3346364 RepID=UPI0036D874BD